MRAALAAATKARRGAAAARQAVEARTEAAEVEAAALADTVTREAEARRMARRLTPLVALPELTAAFAAVAEARGLRLGGPPAVTGAWATARDDVFMLEVGEFDLRFAEEGGERTGGVSSSYCLLVKGRVVPLAALSPASFDHFPSREEVAHAAAQIGARVGGLEPLRVEGSAKAKPSWPSPTRQQQQQDEEEEVEAASGGG